MQEKSRPSRLVDYFLTVGAVDTTNLQPYHHQTSRDDFFGVSSIDVITSISIVPTDRCIDFPSSDYYCINETVEGNYAGINAGGYFNFNKLLNNKHNGPFIAFKRANKYQQEQLLLFEKENTLKTSTSLSSSSSTSSINSNDNNNNAFQFTNVNIMDNYKSPPTTNTNDKQPLYDKDKIVFPITNIGIRDVDEYIKLHPNIQINNHKDNNLTPNNTKNDANNTSSGSGSGGLMSSFKKRLSGSSKKIKIDLKELENKNQNQNNSSYKLPPPQATKSFRDDKSSLIKWELISINNLNNNKSIGNKNIEIWIQRDPFADPIIDLVIINETKNELIPFGYSKVNKINKINKSGSISLNCGSSYRDKLYLCSKIRSTSDYKKKHKKRFEPKIINRYPLNDYIEFPLSQSVAPFCFPRGMEIIPGKKKKKKKKKKKIKKKKKKNLY